MRESLHALCKSFVENRDRIKGAFGWESTYLYPVCAAVFTDKHQIVSEEKMKLCRDILKEETGVFSNFRSTARLVMISMMAADESPELKLKQALKVYKLLKGQFYANEYLPVASMVIADLAQEARYEVIAARTRSIYDLMKKEHPFLTGGEDSLFATLLALSDKGDEQVVDEMEQCYQILKTEFFSANAVQSLSHVLALEDGSSEEKCKKVIELFTRLKNAGHKYGTDYELSTLGVLAMLPADLETICQDIVQVDEFLSGQKGYGILGIGKKQRLMHAGMIVTSDYMQGQDKAISSAAISSTISLIVAQQAAMCAAIAASAAASASSGS